MSNEESIHLAFRNIEEGNIQQARNICNGILDVKPDDVDALFLLGIISYQLNEYESAIRNIQKALLTDPDFPEAHVILGNIYLKKKNLDEAIHSYQKAIQLNTNNADAYFNLGNIFRARGMLDEAADNYQKAIAINPNLAQLYNSLGAVLAEQGKLHEALSNFSKALAVNPEDVRAYCGLGNVLGQMNRMDEAIQTYIKALQFNPADALTLYNLGYALKEQGEIKEALKNFDKAIYYDPDMIEARLARCVAQIPIMYENPESIQLSRDSYSRELINLSETIPLETEQDIESAAKAVGSHQPFYLAYQGFNDKDLQQTYGDLICRIMSLRHPQFAKRPAMPQLLPSNDQIRVGFVSGYFYLHSNWKIPIKGWIENLDRQRFKIFGYYTGKIKDSETRSARQCFSRFVEDVYSLEALCQNIKTDDLHILIYPEIGMDPITLRLAALRLAPVQCASWGHPETSGLPTIDYYLSSDLMEPYEADSHYTECLVRLPNLSIHYSPLEIKNTVVKRNAFGLPEKSLLYLCPQSLFKYLPQYDIVFPLIAQQVGDCRFLFISHNNDRITDRFRSRLCSSFKSLDLNAEDYVVFLPRLDPLKYFAVNSLANVYLDSIGWSGCNSTFEALAHNLPLLTFRGGLMRGRHTSAILTMMDMTETIASTLDEYVDLAVELGRNHEWLKTLSAKIAANKHRVYRDMTCITALEDFIQKVIKERTRK